MKTKYVIIIPDGAADEPIEAFDGKTVIEAAETPNIDRIAMDGKQGLVRTVPEGMTAGSDVAQMSLLGYDPTQCYSGRAPIEAAAMGIPLDLSDWVFRCNLVTFADEKMADHSAGHISTDEAKTLITDLAEALDDIEGIRFYTGVSYRHLFVVSEMDFDITTQPPHDIIGKKIVKNLPKGKNADFLNDIMARSQQLFDNHQINRVRKDLDENAASSVWFWGQGRKAALERFSTRFGLKGAAITAVDLVRGLAKLIGFDLIEVEGATGYIDTNYQGKAEAAIEALNDYDIVFVHVEAPDEAGHAGNAAAKMRALEDIDEYIVGPVYEAIKQYDSYRILVMPDHPTPVATQAHSDEPVPFAIAGTGMEAIVPKPFSEKNALDSGFSVEKGHELMEYFLKV